MLSGSLGASLQVTFREPLDVVLASGPIFWDAEIPGERKAPRVLVFFFLKMWDS